MMLDTSQLLILGAVAALGYVVYHGSRRDPREPPLVSGSVPIIGHLLGQVMYGVEYWSIQAKKHASYPIFALDMLVNKSYVVSSPELMQAVQRNNKTISFQPLLDFSISNIAGAQDKKILHLMQSGSGGLGHAHKIVNALPSTLIGKSLDEMNLRMVKLMRPFIDEMGKMSTFDLYGWCQDTIMDASTDATYGPLNPYADKKVAKAFWDFEQGLGPLMANNLPWLTARKAWKGRQKVADAILKYARMGGQWKASELAKVRFKITLEGDGVTLADYAQLEVPMMIAFVSNTVPATFWTLFDLYSRPELLEEIRDEVRSKALTIKADGTHQIEIAALRNDCPLLLSTFQEILRTRTTSSPTRVVMKDTLLADKYLLKAGSIVTMPAAQIGSRPEVWGETQKSFDPRRFMKADSSKTQSGERESRRVGAFMTFGVSPTICPGRHFASSEILGMVAMMILRYEIVPVDGWVMPKKLVSSMVSIMRPVKSEYPVDVKPRQAYEGARWDYHVEEGKGQFPLVIG